MNSCPSQKPSSLFYFTLFLNYLDIQAQGLKLNIIQNEGSELVESYLFIFYLN